MIKKLLKPIDLDILIKLIVSTKELRPVPIMNLSLCLLWGNLLIS